MLDSTTTAASNNTEHFVRKDAPMAIVLQAPALPVYLPPPPPSPVLPQPQSINPLDKHKDPDHITVLTALNTGKGTPRMTKTWFQGNHGIECQLYDNAWLFRVTSLEVRSSSALFLTLATLKTLPAVCVIRASILLSANPDKTPRRIHAKSDQPATFEECARRWILLDFDKLNVENFPNLLQNPEGCAEAVRQHLPAGLRQTTMFWSFSSSTGMKPGKLGIHLYMLLEHALGWRDSEAFMAACGADTAMSRAVQVHYTAAPSFKNGLIDPLPQRHGVLEGSERVSSDTINALVSQGYAQLFNEREAPPKSRPRKERSGQKSSEPNKSPVETTPGMIGDGQRHAHLLRLAGHARSRGLTEEQLDMVLCAENSYHFEPPLAESEPSGIARSFSRYQVKHPLPNITPFRNAVSIAAGLLRAGACEITAVKAANLMLPDEKRAREIVGTLSSMPLWALEAATFSPGLVLPEQSAK